MLGKLMKYDLRSGIRTFSLIWIGLALLGAINGLTIRFVLAGDTQSGLVSFVFGVLPMILLVALYVAMGIFVLVFIIDRFYKGLLGNEGYLMFTLPVTSTAHIASKAALTSMIFSVASAIVALLSGVLLMAVLTPLNFSDVAQAFQEAGRYLRVNPLPAGTGWLIAEFAVYMLIAAAVSILQIYTAISIGHLGKKNRGWFALLAYVGISIAFSIIMNGCMSLLQSDAFPNVLLNWEFCLDDTGWHVQGVGMMASTIGIGIGLELLKGTGFFFATRAILSKRLGISNKKKRSRPENFLTGSFARKNAENRKITVVSPRCKWKRWTAAGTCRRQRNTQKSSPPDRVSGGDGRLSGIHPMNRLRPSRARVSAAALSRMARNTVSLPESEPTSPGRGAMPSTAVHTAGASPGSVLMMTRFWQA